MFRLALLACIAALGCRSLATDQWLVVVHNGKYGYIDTTGQVVIQPQFIWADDFWRGSAPAYVCGRYAAIDRSSRLSSSRQTAPGQLEVRRAGERVGFVNRDGHFAVAPSFDEALPFREGLAAVRVGDRWGFIDTTGTHVIPPRFSSAYFFREGVASAGIDGVDVLIDRTGRVLASDFGSVVDLVSHGRVPVSKDGRGGYLNLEGQVVIPLIYESVRLFSGGLAAVETAGKWGYIDPAGRMVIQPAFDEAGTFGSGLAPVKVGSRTGFIDKSGAFAFDLAFSYAPGFLRGDHDSNMFVADGSVSRFWTEDQKFGYVNTAGTIVWGPSEESPDHPPLFGWSDDEKLESCRGISDSMRLAATRLPER